MTDTARSMGLAYFKARGISPQTVNENKITILEATTVANLTQGKQFPAIRIPYMDPRTGEEMGYRLRFIGPSLPVDKDGKEQRYWQPYGQRNLIYVPQSLRQTHPEQPGPLGDPFLPLDITEGEMKALKACQESFPCVALSGVWNWRGRETPGDKGSRSAPIPGLDLVEWANRPIRLVFDSDVATNRKLHRALKSLSAELINRRALIHVVTLPDDKGEKVGLDDYLVKQGREHYRTLLHEAQPFQEWRKAQKEEEPENPKTTSNSSSKKRMLDEIRAILSNRIRFNTLANLIEVDGSPIDLDTYYLELLDEYGLFGGQKLVTDWISRLAVQNSYSPVVNYLEAVHKRHEAKTLSKIEDIATRYFGTTEPLYNTYVKRTLIGAVARAFEPGCKLDTVLILQGGQGYGKSTFFKVLAGDFFDDSMGPASDTDNRVKLHRAWIHEWAELESIFSKRDISQIKAFLTCAVDTVRVAYARTHQPLPRPSIIVGSTNKTEVLTDPTGHRRFWMLPVQQRINHAALHHERDELWAAAVELYKRGERYHLTEEESALSSQFNEHFQSVDFWEDIISEWIGERPQVTVHDVLKHAIGGDAAHHGRGSQMRVADCLQRLGYERKKSDGKMVWRKKAETAEEVSLVSLNPEKPLQSEEQSTGIPKRDTLNKEELGIPVQERDTKTQGHQTQGLPEKVSLPETRPQSGIGIQGYQNGHSEKFFSKNITRGSKVVYIGPEGAMKVTCGRKHLEVLGVDPDNDMVMINWEKWMEPKMVLRKHLKPV